MAKDRRIGPWSLLEPLGRGGNAEVWKATAADEEPVALKVLLPRRLNPEGYGRFRREVETVRGLDGFAGVLPVLDAYLPERASTKDRPWVAMPLAEPIRGALGEASLDTVVESMAAVARTLSALAADHQIGHRDIKPDNLYSTSGEWLVGDFGLIDVPDVETLTREDRPIGSRYYAPWELITDPGSASPFPADVYALGKTLWVLATGQNYPPEGPQSADVQALSIDQYRPHRSAAELDRLVERMTQRLPDRRPSMAEVQRDLEAWLDLSEGPTAIDVSDLRERARAKISRELADEDLQEGFKRQATEAIKALEELIEPLNQTLRDMPGRVEINKMGSRYEDALAKSLDHISSPDYAVRWRRWSFLQAGKAPTEMTLRLGRGIEVTTEGELLLHLYLDVGYPNLSGVGFRWHPAVWRSPVGSLEMTQAFRAAVDEMAKELRPAIEDFVEQLPAESG